MIRLEGVYRHHRLDAVVVDALSDVNVAFAAGQATAIVGPSGSGKSTLLHVAALLDAPDGGTVWMDGQPVSRLGDDARSALRLRKIGFVHQTYPMLGALTPRQNVALPAVWAGTPRRAAEERAGHLLERLGLGAHADREVRTLSGGERQRVAIARAVVNRPAVVYADEPSSALDSANGARILALLFEVAREEGVALVLATHDASVAARADTIVRIDGGRLV
jgi:lipoprotein-releasing system ATP-binding protein